MKTPGVCRNIFNLNLKDKDWSGSSNSNDTIHYMKSIGIEIQRPTPSYNFKFKDLEFYCNIKSRQIILFHSDSYMEWAITEEDFNKIWETQL